ncbi:MAG: NACHT domain-containing protein, partial [Cyanobacteria bacterium P01_G01_bin.67]
MRHQANLLLYVPQYQGKNMAGDRNINTEGGNYNENFRDYIVNVNPNNNQTRLEYRNRQTLLNKVNNFWIKGVLEKSLLNQILIELNLEERPGAASYPWNISLQSPNNKPKPLPQGTKIIDIFQQIDEGESLLILGEPGAGKTTTLLDLTRELIDRAKKNDEDSIPVVFNLSSWKVNKRKFADWLVEELNSQYKVPNKIARSFIKHDRLLLLLDGLDEVEAGCRDDYINALNQFRQQHCPKIVVCSRIKDYETLDKSLQFQKAICLRLLTLEQVRCYLNSLGFNITGLKALIEKDEALQELAKSPLMLNVMILAYQGVDIEDMPETNVIEERQTRLFDDYIGRMLNYDRTFIYQASSKNRHKYAKEYAKSWLIWLAKKMSHESKTVFLIERIQPTCINKPVDKLLYLLIYLSIETILHISSALLGTLALFMFSKNLDLFQLSLKIMTWGFVILFFTLYIARIGYLSTDNIDENFRIKPVENLSFSYKRFVQTWKSE